MILTVSTILDTRANVARFVERNCAQGVDHLVLFLDADQPDLVDLLSQDARVTVVPTAGGWWRPGERPRGLNRRQAVNASVVNCVLAGHHWATWLFHIDGDEVLLVDRDELERLPPSVRAVRLEVLEAVSSDDPADAGWFKRALTRDEERTARRQGLLGRSRDGAYFHGHTSKAGVRPSPGLRYNIHGARHDDGSKVAAETSPHARLLHYESSTFEEFRRKWGNLAAGGAARRLKLRPERRELAERFAAVLEQDLTPPDLERELRGLYHDFVEDSHADALRRLGYLLHVDPDVPRSSPRTPDPGALQAFRSALAAVADIDKTVLLDGPEEARRAELDRAARR